MKVSIVCLALLVLSGGYRSVRAQAPLSGSLVSIWNADSPKQPENGDNGDKPLLIRSFAFEVQTAWIENFMMFGALAKLNIYYPFNISIRYSVSLNTFQSWFIPYIGMTIPKVGGFEIGVKPPYSEPFELPGYVTWRIFGGDERYFAISADILTNVPVGNVGFWDAGCRFRVSDDGSTVYVGAANYGHTKDEPYVLGPAVKTSWAMGPGSFLLVSASYILSKGNGPGHYYRYTIGAGWRFEF